MRAVLEELSEKHHALSRSLSCRFTCIHVTLLFLIAEDCSSLLQDLKSKMFSLMFLVV